MEKKDTNNNIEENIQENEAENDNVEEVNQEETEEFVTEELVIEEVNSEVAVTILLFKSFSASVNLPLVCFIASTISLSILLRVIERVTYFPVSLFFIDKGIISLPVMSSICINWFIVFPLIISTICY